MEGINKYTDICHSEDGKYIHVWDDKKKKWNHIKANGIQNKVATNLTRNSTCDEIEECFVESLPRILAAKKREFEILDLKRCSIIDQYKDDKNLKVYLLFFDFINGYTKLTKEVKKMTRIMGIGGKRNRRERGMAIMPLEEVKSMPFEEIYEFQKIKRTRTGFSAICPLHIEKTGSFNVKGKLFKCFSCGKGGSNVDFIMALHGLDFVSAVRHLQGLKK